jgi:hypothetical protein
MSISSSIFGSERESGGGSPGMLVRQLAKFAAPYVVALIAAAFLVYRTGELLPTSYAAYLQASGSSILYGVAFSDRNYQFKTQSARVREPDVLIIGASRANQWRSMMFAPHSFYNGANSAYTQRDYRRWIEDLGKVTPRVIIFSLDSYTFTADWDPNFTHVSYDDDIEFGSAKQRKILKDLIDEALKNPSAFFSTHEPVYGLPAIGLEAIRIGDGFRRDGSLQYGGLLRGTTQLPTLESVIGRVKIGTTPFQFAKELDFKHREELERFAQHARKKTLRSWASRCLLLRSWYERWTSRSVIRSGANSNSRKRRNGSGVRASFISILRDSRASTARQMSLLIPSTPASRLM